MTKYRAFRRIRPEQYLVVLVGLLVLLLLGFQMVEALESSHRRVGILVEEIDGTIVLSDVEAGSPAEAGGLQVGDRLLGMDGAKLERIDDYDDIAQNFSRDQPVRYEVLRDGQRFELTVLPGMAFPFLTFLVLVPVLVAYLSLGLLALSQRGNDLRARLLTLLVIAVAVELVLPVDPVGSPHLETLVHAAFLLLTGLQIGLELHLVSVIPNEPQWLKQRAWIARLYYTFGLGLAGMALLPFLTESWGQDFVPWSYDWAEFVLMDIGLPLWAMGVVFLLARTALRHPDPVGRHQAGLVLVGVLPWAVMIFYSVTLDLTGQIAPDWVVTFEPLVLLFLPLATFSAIFRYHLFDLEMVVRRSLIYTVLTASLVLIFYLMVGVGGALLSSRAAGSTRIWTIAAATLLMGLLFSPLRDAVQRIIDRNFFRERTELRQQLVQLAGKLPSLGSLPSMASELVEQLCEAFGIGSATVMIVSPGAGVLSTQAAWSSSAVNGTQGLLLSVEEDGVQLVQRARRPLATGQIEASDPRLAERLEQLGVEVVVPILLQEELVGLLLLGHKQDGEAYVSEELELLSLLSHHIATIFENARLFESATRDGLTGLLRRGAVLAELEREMQRARRFGRPLTVAMADLDDFKRVNDEHGHLAGDIMLRRVSRRLTEGLRSSDVIGRYGGEEFLFLLPETRLSGAIPGADKIRRMIEELEVPLETGAVLRITISVGMASLEELRPESHPSSSDLIDLADRRLYRAKHRGRNRVEPESEQSGPDLTVVKG